MMNVEHSRRNDLVDVLLIIEQALPSQDQFQDRGDAYEYLLREARRSKERVILWLKRSRLWDEVKNLGEPNAFNMIPCTCSRRVAELISDAPGVESVVPGDTPLELVE